MLRFHNRVEGGCYCMRIASVILCQRKNSSVYVFVVKAEGVYNCNVI